MYSAILYPTLLLFRLTSSQSCVTLVVDGKLQIDEVLELIIIIKYKDDDEMMRMTRMMIMSVMMNIDSGHDDDDVSGDDIDNSDDQ